MSTTAGRLPHVSRTYSDASKIISACLSVVSPPELISNSLSFDADSGTLSVAGRKYHVKKYVSLCACCVHFTALPSLPPPPSQRRQQCQGRRVR